MIPPQLLRRLVLTPAGLLLMLGLAVVLPPAILVATVLSPWLPGRRRALRMLTFALVYAVLESAAVLACLGLWFAGGLGWRLRTRRLEDAHYGLLRWLLDTLVRVAERVFRLRLAVHGPLPAPAEAPETAGAPEAEEARRPVLVLCRHAGPGDSFLLIHQLLSSYRRRPRIIMKDTLQLDPALDVICNRLPNAFIRPKPGADVEILEQIRTLSAGLDPDGALVLFPEGGNFTERRRLRVIRSLEQRGFTEEAHRAREMEHLLAPRPSGVNAAVEAAPDADVVLVAHTGLDQLRNVADIWHGIPMEQTVNARWWHIAHRTIPEDLEARTRWLYEWWARMDKWIHTHQIRDLPPPSPRRSAGS